MANKKVVALAFPAAVVAGYLAGKIPDTNAFAVEVHAERTAPAQADQNRLDKVAENLLGAGVTSAVLSCSQDAAFVDGVEGIYWFCSGDGVTITEAQDVPTGEELNVIKLPKQ
jgi:hypothetical protein